MPKSQRERRSSAFDPEFLARLEQLDEPGSSSEAEWSGEWRVFSAAPDHHLVVRGWEHPLEGDDPVAVFADRATALLCAAILPLDARPSLFALSRPADPPWELAILVRDTYGEASAREIEPIGQARCFSQSQLYALHLAGCFARSPRALALLLEAAGPTAVRLVGEILHRHLVTQALP
ncbi:MAG: hypothetical protein ACRELA_12515 [Candidatus Rokuibacteriota bacterium]